MLIAFESSHPSFIAPGIALLALSLGLLQIVLDRGQRADWFNSPWVVCATTFSALSFVLLILRELSFSEPLLIWGFSKKGYSTLLPFCRFR